MSLTVTHITKDIAWHWAIRFTGPDKEFHAMRERLKRSRNPSAIWSPSYAWKDGKRGAWLIVAHILYEMRPNFSNLQGTCTSRRERTAIVYETVFWTNDANYDPAPLVSMKPI